MEMPLSFLESGISFSILQWRTAMDIRTYLKQQTLITDGAMGTYYSASYPDGEELAERENLLHPERIRDIHGAYIRSGARLLRTNTFAVNSGFFSDRRSMREYILAGYRIAEEAVEQYGTPGEAYFIAADIGTVFDAPFGDRQQLLEEYRFLADCFLEAGAEIFLFETQADLGILGDLTAYIKGRKGDAFVMVSFSFDKTGYTRGGLRLERMVEEMAAAETVDAYGLNCGVEGNHMAQLLERVTFPNDKYLLALPNAGYPFVLRGKTIYGKNIPYFLEMEEKLFDLGVDILGGCCGTTPAYIEGIHGRISGRKRRAKRIGTPKNGIRQKTMSEFWKKLQQGEQPFVVELDPPFDLNTEKVLRGAELLKEHDVDLLTLSDSPMARARMDASLLGSRIQHEVGIQVMPHISCRDRNIISLRGTLLGDYDSDIRHFLLVTGDPVAPGDRGTVTQVFDYNSIKLMGFVQEMNRDLFAGDKVVYGGALNYHGENPEAIARRMEMKMQQGCSYFLTQPVYSREDAERIAFLKERTGAKVLVGIFPLVSYKNALFMANEMPGVRIPPQITEAYRPDMSREEAEEIAVKISVDIAKMTRETADGYYLMTPFNRVGLICRIIEEIRKER